MVYDINWNCDIFELWLNQKSVPLDVLQIWVFIHFYLLFILFVYSFFFCFLLIRFYVFIIRKYAHTRIYAAYSQWCMQNRFENDRETWTESEKNKTVLISQLLHHPIDFEMHTLMCKECNSLSKWIATESMDIIERKKPS